MRSVEEAIALWRSRRVVLSEDCETTIDVWMADLQGTLAEFGLSELELIAYLDDNPRTWMENEYESFLERTGAQPKIH